MKVTGFTFIRNAIKLDYPIVEAIKSILPICSDFVVAVGNSEDITLQLIKSIDPNKIRIIETIWDDTLRENGAVLALETNKAFHAISNESDWAFYIQGDEVIHEKYLPTIQSAMIAFKDRKEIDGLLFNYHHFYGSYDYIGASSKWYREEIRIIKNDKSIYSYKDAQGFRKVDNQKLKVKLIDAYIYHYGWVKPPEIQREKMKSSINFWGEGKDVDKIKEVLENFDYSEIDSLKLFHGTHPAVMQARIDSVNWMFDYDIREKKLSFKNQVKMAIENLTGYRIGEYRNYRLL